MRRLAAVPRWWMLGAGVMAGLSACVTKGDVQLVQDDVALLKAQTSVRFNQPSKHLEKGLVEDGIAGLANLPGVACFEGAVPIRLDGALRMPPK